MRVTLKNFINTLLQFRLEGCIVFMVPTPYHAATPLDPFNNPQPEALLGQCSGQIL